MRNPFISTVRCVAVVLSLSACGEDPASQQQGHGAVDPTTTESASQSVRDAVSEVTIVTGTDYVAVNATCPLSAEEIDPNGRKALYHGNAYGFCCDDCLDAFKSDPEKYVASR